MESWSLIILVITPGVWSGDWSVTSENQCALKGTSVLINCKYDYPVGHFVTSVSWFKNVYASGRWGLFPLDKLTSSLDHFKYLGNFRGDCSLKVNDVQHTDEGAYYFRFTTTFNRWMSIKPMYLSVGELTTVIEPSTVTEGGHVALTCMSGCPEPKDIVWFRNGQPVSNPVFQARREDAGDYYCAVHGQESVRSAPVALNVQYAPREVTLSVSPWGDIRSGGTATLTCSSDANPPVAHSGYSLYKDGQLLSSGQNYIISDILPSDRGWYYCQAWNNISWRGIDLINSTEVHLDVRYPPTNISISVDPQLFDEGSSVNLTCSSVANPAADSYIWYKMVDSDATSSMLQVGSGQLLSLPSVEESHGGVYLCKVRNSLGESNSTQVLLSMQRKQDEGQSLPVLAGIGVSLLVTLVVALLLFRKKQKTSADKKRVFDSRLIRTRSRSSATEDPPDTTYANIHPLPSSTPSVPPQAISTASQRSSHRVDTASYEDEVTYSTVTIRPKDPSFPHHLNSNRQPQHSWSEARENNDSVIYASVFKSS
ncbi:B-cell receptor CD22 isoform X1 [Haplochromis burtoni]|nr:B-cell receptor CD22 isoform X1 [Haplochromis burtoni]